MHGLAYHGVVDHPEGLTIAAVSAELGVPVPTIRSWERRYGFPSPARTPGRHRRYSRREVALLRALRDEIAHGFPAREAVRRVLERTGRAPGPAADLVADVVEAANRLDPTGLRAALDAATLTLGVEPAIRDVALPAMREIGHRWATGRCDVAQEHLASEGVRGWLARMLALAPEPFRLGPVLLAAGPKELHTIGLEAFAVILARRGWPVRVLGSLPAAALVAAARRTRAVAVVVTCHRAVTRRSAVEAIAAAAEIPGVTVFYGGAGFSAPSRRRDVPGTYLGEDLVEAGEVLERSVLRSGTAPSRSVT